MCAISILRNHGEDKEGKESKSFLLKMISKIAIVFNSIFQPKLPKILRREKNKAITGVNGKENTMTY